MVIDQEGRRSDAMLSDTAASKTKGTILDPFVSLFVQSCCNLGLTVVWSTVGLYASDPAFCSGPNWGRALLLESRSIWLGQQGGRELVYALPDR